MSQHRHQMFPSEFLQHLCQHFNGVLKTQLLVVTANKLEIQFDRTPFNDKSVVISLFTKLVTAFKSISNKYLSNKDQHNQIRLKPEDREDKYVISISGVMYVPPGKILNLFSLILWYYILYTTGTSPSGTDKGILLNEKWKKEEKLLRFKINQSPRRVGMLRDEGPCYICGDISYKVNNWEFRPNPRSRGIEMITRVCNKHVTNLI